jgi:ABC-type uncharacterized transport system substrate-binding protein
MTTRRGATAAVGLGSLRGDAPPTLPMKQARDFDLSINLKAANALKIEVPQSVLVRASKVIDRIRPAPAR